MNYTNILKNCRIYVDMDGTMVVWKAAKSLEDLLEKGYFRGMPPYESVVTAIKILIAYGANVYALSAYMEENPYSVQEKNEWLDEFIPEIPAEKRIFCPCGTNKWEAVINASGGTPPQENLLLDDYSFNLHQWKEKGGVGIKLMNGVNGNNGTWQGEKISRFLPPLSIADEIVRVAAGIYSI